MLLLQLALGLQDPPTPDRLVSQLVPNDRLDQAPLHRLAQHGPIDRPFRMRRLALLHQQRLLSRDPPPVQTGQDFTSREDVVPCARRRAAFRGRGRRRPRGVVFVLGERGRQVRFVLQPLIVLADLMQRDGSCARHGRVISGRERVARRTREETVSPDSRDCVSAIDWQSVVVISRMMPSTAAT